MPLLRLVSLAALLAIAASVAVVWALSARDVAARRAQLAAEHTLANTAHGTIEYSAWGEGPAVVVIHGAGGGFDQGQLIAEAFGGDGFHWIAVSRFGYLGSPLPADASTAAQADAIAELLDQLHIARAAVLGFSGGAPPALQLAERHPDRVTALALLSSAPFTPYAPPEAERPLPDWLYQALFGNDAMYWTLAKTNPGMLRNAFDARPELLQNPDEARFAARLVDGFLPASMRAAGVRNEGAAIDPRATYALESITTPTLLVHSRDDRLNQFAIGEALARRLPVVEFMPLDRGGHLLLGHHAEVRARVASFLAAHAR